MLLLISGFLSFYPLKLQGKETKLENTTSSPITKETPTEIVSEIIKEEKVEKRHVLNFLSRIDEEKISDRSKYAELGYLDGFYQALEDNIEEDRLFYVWEDYEQGDLVVKNQILNAIWDIGVAKLPKFFGRVEKAGRYLKRKTTWDHRIRGYRVKINPELDNEDFLQARIKIKKDESFIDNLELRVNKEEIKLGKTWKIEEEIAHNATFSLDMNYNWNKDEYCFRITLKFPYWFNDEKD